MKKFLVHVIIRALQEAQEKGEITLSTVPPIPLEVPPKGAPGDLATALAMTIASLEKRSPREIAEVIVKNIRDPQGIIDRVEIAGPGYINFVIKQEYWCGVLREILRKGTEYGRSNIGKGQRVLIEFVSANPTGPLHVGHGRGAAVGNALANLLESAGYDVQREYYVNDAGRQMKLLGLSVYTKYQQRFGTPLPFPEGGYRGDYIDDIVEEIINEEGERYRGRPEDECVDAFTTRAYQQITQGIEVDLQDFGIRLDNWVKESELFEQGKVMMAVRDLEGKGDIYTRDGATWFRSSAYGDEKDRVVIKQDGECTYLASDIAYHKDKLERGFDLLVNIWGADHHGYVPRMEAVVQALGYRREVMRIILVQMVNLLREGHPVSMSKRSGEFIALREVVDEVGSDAALFIFLTRRPDSHLDFDLEVVKKQSSENPVYYVQYAHARLSSVKREAEARGIVVPREVDLSPLILPEEILLMRECARYPDLIEEAAISLEPHRVTFYLQDLAALLHNYYYKHRILSENLPVTYARVVLAEGVRIIIANALRILGVSAPDVM